MEKGKGYASTESSSDGTNEASRNTTERKEKQKKEKRKGERKPGASAKNPIGMSFPSQTLLHIQASPSFPFRRASVIDQGREK